MTILATLEGAVSVEGEIFPVLLGDVELTAPDEFFIDVTVGRAAEVATARRYKQLGVQIRVGGTVIPERERIATLQIAESAESYGDRMTIRLYGMRHLPTARALFRARTPVTVRLKYGAPGNEYTAQVFSGWVVEASADLVPPAITATVLDAVAMYGQRRLKDYSLPPNSGKSRGWITRDMLTLAGIAIGSTDFGPNDGGVFNKPVVPGERPVIDYLRDFLAVVGVEVGFVNNRFVAARYDPRDHPVVELHAGNLALPATLRAPETSRANVLGVVAVKVTRTEPADAGQKTTTTKVTTEAVYAPAAYADRQSVVGGVATLIPGPGPGGATKRVISELITTTTTLGSIELRVEQEEKGWYAERGSRSRIVESEDPPGYTLEPVDAFIYPDGSTRALAQERYQTVRRMIRTKTLDERGNVVATREERYFFRFFRLGLWSVGFDPGSPDGLHEVLTDPLARLNDDGDGVVDGREALGRYGPDEITEVAYVLNDDDTIKEEVTTERFHDIGSKRPRAANAVGYGVDPRTYTNRSREAISPTFAHAGVRVTTKRYRATGEEKYEVVQSVRLGSDPPVTTTTTSIGAPPRPERVQPEQTTQEVRAEVADEYRIALVGEEIDDVEHNEFVQDEEEARAYAGHRARRAGADVLTVDMPIEALIHKWKTVRVNIPGAAIDGKKFFVREVRRDVTTYRQTVVAEHYPPALA